MMRPLVCVFLLFAQHVSSLTVGVNIDPTNSNGGSPPVSDVTQSGAVWVRIEFKSDDASSDPVAASTFDFYDNVIQDYASANVQLIVILDYATSQNVPWGSTNFDDWSSYSNSFATRVSEIASHYFELGLLDYIAFEIWNESDLEATYVPPNSYAYLLNQSYTAIKNVNANTVVIVGGLASGNPGYVQSILDSPQGLNADAIGLHPYGQRPSSDWPSSDWGFGTVADLMNNYYAVSSLPQWITEVGTDDQSVQDTFPWHIFAAIDETSPAYCPVALWFCWSDGMVSPFGLFDLEGNAKQSYYSFQNYSLDW